jgi:hypothetical protein
MTQMEKLQYPVAFAEVDLQSGRLSLMSVVNTGGLFRLVIKNSSGSIPANVN